MGQGSDMSTDRSRAIAWVMWLSGLAMIVLAAVLSEVNPPISTTQAEESALEGAIWLSTWVGFGWSAPWWSRAAPRIASAGSCVE